MSNVLFKAILANSGWLLAERALRLAISILVGAWVARYLGPEQFGLYSYALAFVSMFSAVATLGLNSIVVRDIVREPQRSGEILGTTVVLKGIGGALSFILVLTCAFVFPAPAPGVNLLMAIVAFGNIIQALDAVDLWFQSQLQARMTALARSAALLLTAAVKVYLVFASAPLVAFAIAGLVEILLYGAGLVLTYMASGQPIRGWSVSIKCARRLLRDAWPLAVAGAAILIQARIDQVMLAHFTGERALGFYSVALELVEAAAIVPAIVYTSVAPAVAAARAQGKAAYRQTLLSVYRLMLVLFVVLAAPIAVFSQEIIALLYGPRYADAAPLLALLTLRLFFTNFGLARSLYLTNENLLKLGLAAAVIGGAANIPLNLWLIPRYGAAGAVVAALASFFITTFIVDVFHPEARANLRLMLTGIASPWRLASGTLRGTST